MLRNEYEKKRKKTNWDIEKQKKRITPDDFINNSEATCRAVALPRSGETPLSR